MFSKENIHHTLDKVNNPETRCSQRNIDRGINKRGVDPHSSRRSQPGPSDQPQATCERYGDHDVSEHALIDTQGIEISAEIDMNIGGGISQEITKRRKNPRQQWAVINNLETSLNQVVCQDKATHPNKILHLATMGLHQG